MRIFFFLSAFFTFISCSNLTSQSVDKLDRSKEPDVLNFEKSNEEDEYDVIVFEPGYNTFLVSRAFPKEYYSESFYKQKNRIFVTNWNSRVLNLQFDRSIYEMLINYDSTIDYGLNLEYKLFNFFVFMEWKYNINIDGFPNRYFR